VNEYETMTLVFIYIEAIVLLLALKIMDTYYSFRVFTLFHI